MDNISPLDEWRLHRLKKNTHTHTQYIYIYIYIYMLSSSQFHMPYLF